MSDLRRVTFALAACAAVRIVCSGENVWLSRHNLHQTAQLRVGVGACVEDVDDNIRDTRNRSRRNDEIDLFFRIADEVKTGSRTIHSDGNTVELNRECRSAFYF